MNARGISVFYGANDQGAAVAEVRPPVGSQVVVARFEIIRKLRLLDLTALSNVRVTGSIFDPRLAGLMGRAVFLRSLSRRITKPVMPDDEPFEYLATQAVADFLSTESSMQIDGIIFPSVQASGDVLNVVLLHKASRVETLEIPKGTEIRAQTGQWGEDGWEEDYAVIERVPPADEMANKELDKGEWSDFAVIAKTTPLGPADFDSREISLRIVPNSINVHRIKRVVFETDEFKVRRHRWEKRDIVI
jgi:hypothetical protein